MLYLDRPSHLTRYHSGLHHLLVVTKEKGANYSGIWRLNLFIAILQFESYPTLFHKQHFLFSWCTQSFQDLGIQITPTYQTLFQHNYCLILSHIRSLLKLWYTYHISFLGRVTAIKMVILPKILLFFRSLPVYVTKSSIESLQRDVNKFVWLGKKSQVSFI